MHGHYRVIFYEALAFACHVFNTNIAFQIRFSVPAFKNVHCCKTVALSVFTPYTVSNLFKMYFILRVRKSGA